MELTLFLSFWLCFLNLNYQPHPNYSLICWMMNSSGAKTSIAGDLLAEYRKQSIQLGPVSGSLHWDTFFWCSFFFGGGSTCLTLFEGYSWRISVMTVKWSLFHNLYSSGRRFAWLEWSKRNRWSLRYHGVIQPQVSKATTSSFQPMQMKIVSWPSRLEMGSAYLVRFDEKFTQIFQQTGKDFQALSH